MVNYWVVLCGHSTWDPDVSYISIKIEKTNVWWFINHIENFLSRLIWDDGIWNCLLPPRGEWMENVLIKGPRYRCLKPLNHLKKKFEPFDKHQPLSIAQHVFPTLLRETWQPPKRMRASGDVEHLYSDIYVIIPWYPFLFYIVSLFIFCIVCIMFNTCICTKWM